MHLNAARFVLQCAICAAAAAAAGTAAAQSYPARPVRIVVPNPAGEPSDILARLIAARLTHAWGQRVIVDNRPGANGHVGAELVARGAPDGYTLLLTDVGNLAISPSLYPKLAFDVLRDFTPIATLTYSPHLLSTHPSLPVRDVRGLIALARARPGQLSVPVAPGSAAHLAAMLFAQRTGIDWVCVPAPDGVVRRVVSGEGDALVGGVLQSLPHVKAGRLRALALSGPIRDPSLPDTPTLAEAAGLDGFVTGSWQGMLAPANVPADVVDRVHTEVSRTLATPEMRERLAAQGATSQLLAPADAARWLAAEKDRWAQFVRTSGFELR